MGKTKKVIAAALIITAACLGLLLYFRAETEKITGKSQALTTSAQQAAINKPLITKEPSMPKGFKENITWRDPFSSSVGISPAQNKGGLPVEPEKESSIDETANGTINDVAINRNSLLDSALDTGRDLPVLIGIISSGSKKTAIILDKGSSRAYKVNDRLGEYKLIQIKEKSVILESSEETHELLLTR